MYQSILISKISVSFELPDEWQYVLIENKPNTIHICPKHKIEFSQFTREYIQWKKSMDKKKA